MNSLFISHVVIFHENEYSSTKYGRGERKKNMQTQETGVYANRDIQSGMTFDRKHN